MLFFHIFHFSSEFGVRDDLDRLPNREGLSHSNRDIHRKLTISPADILTCEASRLPPCWRGGMVVSPSTQSHISSTSSGVYNSPARSSVSADLFGLSWPVSSGLFCCLSTSLQNSSFYSSVIILVANRKDTILYVPEFTTVYVPCH
jgi:hypothetical protein